MMDVASATEHLLLARIVAKGTTFTVNIVQKLMHHDWPQLTIVHNYYLCLPFVV